MLDIALLGTGGMMPLPNRYLTSLLCRLNGRMLVIDCGEGTQVAMKLVGWGFKNIDTICFTHFHADHISGLPGLLLTIGNSGRTEPLNIIGPVGLNHVVKSLCVIAPELPFQIITNEYGQKTDGILAGDFEISLYEMNHRIPCFGYSIHIKRKGKFDMKKAESLNLPRYLWSNLQNGNTIEYEGNTFTPHMVLGQERKGIKIAYCTDSRPPVGLEHFVYQCDLFICEGIYGEEEKLQKAIEHCHMIFSEAATIAKKGNVKELWLTHYSPAMSNPDEFIHNANNIFKNTIAGKDGMTKTIIFEDEQ